MKETKIENLKITKETIEVEKLGSKKMEDHPYIIVYGEDLIRESPRYFMIPLHMGSVREGDELHCILDYIKEQTTPAYFETIRKIYRIYNEKYEERLEFEISLGESWAENYNKGVYNEERD